MIFTLYVVKLAKQLEIVLEQINDIKYCVQQKLTDVENKNIFYVSTLLQLVHELDIEYNQEVFIQYYETNMQQYVSFSNASDVDVMDIYHLSIMKNILLISDNMPDELVNEIMASISYSYMNLSLLYDCLYVLDAYSVLETRTVQIKEYIQMLEEYRLDNGQYSAITTINPSIIATANGVELLDEIEMLSDRDVANILNYLKRYYDNDMLKYMSCEELYYFCRCLYILDYTLIENDKYIMELQDLLKAKLNSQQSLTIRELYCANKLYTEFLNDSKDMDLLETKLDETLALIEVDEVSTANKCMLLILLKDISEKEDIIKMYADGVGIELITIMDVYYYVEYCNEYRFEVDESVIAAVMKHLKNDKGYYISRYQQVNSMFTLYLGYFLSTVD